MELLLQCHDYKIYSDSHKLIHAGITVYSVKTDAFTIKKCDLNTSKETY